MVFHSVFVIINFARATEKRSKMIFVAAENVCCLSESLLMFWSLLGSDFVSSSSQKLFREQSPGCSSDSLYQLSRIFFLKHLDTPETVASQASVLCAGRKFWGKFLTLRSINWTVLHL